MPKYEPTSIVENGRLLARVASFGLEIGDSSGLKRYTAWCGRPNDPIEDCEEIDLDAVNKFWARKCAEKELLNGYQPGLEVENLEERFGFYM